MNTKHIEQLIKLLENSTITEIEVGKWGRKIRVSKNVGNVMVQGSGVPASAPVASVSEIPSNGSPVELPIPGIPIKSPMVGTFYRSPSPETDAFVKVGDHVHKGDTLCIIEAMKIMNEVEAEISGVILDIQAENAQPVEYGQTLFMIEP